jgi:diguanylate cyclase (GGDEF)-like protein
MTDPGGTRGAWEVWRPPTTPDGVDVTTAVFSPTTWQALADQQLRDYPKSCALLMVDVDQLRLINQTVGHQNGDHVLRAVADVLRAVSAPGGIVGRVGDDEFVLLMVDVDRSTADAVARKVRQHVALITVESASLAAHAAPASGEVTVTVGVAAGSGLRGSPGAGPGRWRLTDLFWSADAALYAAKART